MRNSKEEWNEAIEAAAKDIEGTMTGLFCQPNNSCGRDARTAVAHSVRNLKKNACNASTTPQKAEG